VCRARRVVASGCVHVAPSLTPLSRPTGRGRGSGKAVSLAHVWGARRQRRRELLVADLVPRVDSGSPLPSPPTSVAGRVGSPDSSQH
jgi:hypothetical protein